MRTILETTLIFTLRDDRPHTPIVVQTRHHHADRNLTLRPVAFLIWPSEVWPPEIWPSEIWPP